ncbi:Protein CBG25911 [Caenorhabditis briggsae]
MGLIS